MKRPESLSFPDSAFGEDLPSYADYESLRRMAGSDALGCEEPVCDLHRRILSGRGRPSEGVRQRDRSLEKA